MCLQASSRNAASTSRLKQTAKVTRVGTRCCWYFLCTLRLCWAGVKIHLKCSHGLGCVTSALESAFDPSDILSLCQKMGLDLFMLTLEPSLQRKVCELMCWLESVVSWPGPWSGWCRVRIAVLPQSQLLTTLDLTSASHWSPCYWKVWAMGNRCRCLLKQGMQPKPLYMCQSYRCVQTAISCPKGRNWI